MDLIPVTLNIILTACKVPHEIAQVHEAGLIPEKETEVFTECRTNNSFPFRSGADRISFPPDLSPVFISCFMVRFRAVHPGKDSFELFVIIIFRMVIRLIFPFHLVIA